MYMYIVIWASTVHTHCMFPCDILFDSVCQIHSAVCGSSDLHSSGGVGWIPRRSRGSRENYQ